MLLLVTALAFAASAFWSSPSQATLITNTYYGTIAADSSNDIGGYFGGGNLAGDSFTLVMTLNTTRGGVHQPNFNINGGTYYNGTDPFTTVTLTINGHTYNNNSQPLIGNSGAALFPQVGTDSQNPGEVIENAFTYNSGKQLQTESIYIDLNVLKTISLGSLGYNVALPAMQASNGDFTNLYSTFSDSNDYLDLNVLSVNAQPTTAPVPEPGTMVLLGVGMLGLAIYGKRRNNFKKA